jgi:hypothetical protein
LDEGFILRKVFCVSILPFLCHTVVKFPSGYPVYSGDTYNALVDVIAKQRLNIRNKTILSNLCQTFADHQAAEPGCRENTGARKRKAANSLCLGLESPTSFVLQGLPRTASTMMGV